MLVLIPIILLPSILLYTYLKQQKVKVIKGQATVMENEVILLSQRSSNGNYSNETSFVQDVMDGVVRIGNCKVGMLEKLANMSTTEFYVWQAEQISNGINERDMRDIARARIWRKDPIFIAALIDQQM
uniref:Uncharacterized protein n=1 Tax=viral metagenome TaxID=1070528 RepID=A0A6C0I3X0_9ZZZZ